MTLEEAKERCWLEVDLDALCENYLQAKKFCSDNTIVIPVLKANAYGLGARQVGRTLFEMGARLFAVATGDEALELQDALQDAQVLVLGRVGQAQMAQLIENDILLTLYSAKQAQLISKAAQSAGKKARIHVKIDTGLHRLGFSKEEAAGEIEKFLNSGSICLEGMYTHLGLHTQETDAAQFEALESVFEALKARGIHVPMLHALDSIGMVRYPQKQYSAVRVGAWLYGVTPSGCPFPEKCKPVARFCSRVSQVRYVKKGELIGYDDENFLQRDSRIVTISAGYVDGVARRQTDGRVEIGGAQALVHGIACMDQMMADGTDLPACEEGDEVCFFGGQITLDEYAARGGLNRNEAISTIGNRVPRVYKKGEKQWTVKN